MLAERQHDEAAISPPASSLHQFTLSPPTATPPATRADQRSAARDSASGRHDVEGAGEVGQRDDQRRLLLDPRNTLIARASDPARIRQLVRASSSAASGFCCSMRSKRPDRAGSAPQERRLVGQAERQGCEPCPFRQGQRFWRAGAPSEKFVEPARAFAGLGAAGAMRLLRAGHDAAPPDGAGARHLSPAHRPRCAGRRHAAAPRPPRATGRGRSRDASARPPAARIAPSPARVRRGGCPARDPRPRFPRPGVAARGDFDPRQPRRARRARRV